MKKAGRPIKEMCDKLKYRIAVKFCVSDYYIIKVKSREAGMTPTEFVRQTSINGSVQGRMTVEMLDYIRKLSGMANNLNQIARKANTFGYINVRLEYLYLAEKLDKLLNLIIK